MDNGEGLKNLQRERPTNLVQTIERVSLILDILTRYPKGISVGGLSAKIKLPKGTVHRLLTSLGFFGFVRQDSTTKFYQLGFRLMELGNVVLSHIDLRNEARPILLDLADQVKETVHLVVKDNDEVIYIDKVEPLHEGSGLQMVSRLGTRIPLHCSSVGKVILAHLRLEEINSIINRKGLSRRTENTICDKSQLFEHLEHIRQVGYAIDNEENEKGIRCVAAPIRNVSNMVIAAISISAPSARVTMKMLKSGLKEDVRKTAAAISKKLGYNDSQE